MKSWGFTLLAVCLSVTTCTAVTPKSQEAPCRGQLIKIRKFTICNKFTSPGYGTRFELYSTASIRQNADTIADLKSVAIIRDDAERTFQVSGKEKEKVIREIHAETLKIARRNGDTGTPDSTPESLFQAGTESQYLVVILKETDEIIRQRTSSNTRNYASDRDNVLNIHIAADNVCRLESVFCKEPKAKARSMPERLFMFWK